MLGFEIRASGRTAVMLGLLLAIFLMSCPIVLAQSFARLREGSQARQSYVDGLERYNTKDYSGVIPLLVRALELEPEFSEAELVLAWSLYRVGRYPEATLHFRQIIVRQPGWAKPYNGLGWSRFQVNRYTLALDAFRQALALDPTSREARVGFAYSLFAMGRYAEALPRLERLTLEGEGNASQYLLADVEQIRARLAWALFYLGDFPRAREQFLKGLAARPDWAGLHNGLGWTYLRLGDRAQAVASFQRALHLQPDLADARDGLAEAGS